MTRTLKQQIEVTKMKVNKQIFGTKSVERRGVELSIHHVKNVSVEYDRELFAKDKMVVVYVNIEYTDGIHDTPLYHHVTMFADNTEVRK